MNLVVCRHPGNGGHFLFRLPHGMAIEPDTMVVVETIHGEQPAVTITGNFQGDPDQMVKHWGGRREIKRVLKILREYVIEWTEEEIRDNGLNGHEDEELDM